MPYGQKLTSLYIWIRNSVNGRLNILGAGLKAKVSGWILVSVRCLTGPRHIKISKNCQTNKFFTKSQSSLQYSFQYSFQNLKQKLLFFFFSNKCLVLTGAQDGPGCLLGLGAC